MFWFKICQSLIVVILIILMIKMIKDVVAGENLATMIVVMILILIILLIKVIIDLGSKPGNDDVNLGPTGAKDASSLLHSDPAEAGSEF